MKNLYFVLLWKIRILELFPELFAQNLDFFTPWKVLEPEYLKNEMR